MKKLTTFIAAMTLILLSGNLLLAQSVKVDYDRTVDFNNFKTFTFKGWEKNSDQQLNDLDKDRIQKAFGVELTDRGITESSSDHAMAITLYIVTQEKTSTTAYTNYTGGMGYGRAGWGWGGGYGVGVGMGMGSSTTTYSQSDYEVGTLVINFYDEANKKLIWQGTLQGTVKSNPKKREKSIPKSIAKLMSKYPIKPTN